MPAIPVAVNYGGILKEIQMVESDMTIICDHIRKMPEDGLMVEWGSGGSTCKWIETLTNNQKLITIEHNESWYNRVTRAVNAEFGNVENKFTFYHKPELHIQHGYGNIIEEHPCGVEEYINPDNAIWDADFFFVDGITRGACVSTILHKRKKQDSVIMIHDYVGREFWYEWVVQFFDVETFSHIDQYSTLSILTLKK
jgi:hypothetical protein